MHLVIYPRVHPCKCFGFESWVAITYGREAELFGFGHPYYLELKRVILSSLVVFTDHNKVLFPLISPLNSELNCTDQRSANVLKGLLMLLLWQGYISASGSAPGASAGSAIRLSWNCGSKYILLNASSLSGWGCSSAFKSLSCCKWNKMDVLICWLYLCPIW